ncbi:hypothetical protein ELG77_33180 (plasmid) [Rhizobium leguminosarum]|uniref:hypothetical protein n=1 Tax=Rhizobium leguminosarum TaxID=384 RepID=UPI0010308802|nr:hypothetical protein [Rhizobium leguminosarum]TBF23425.1 hypothetical protein ELG92_34285 [Rhizobium leguminosarum]TBG29519.1 hypothetical protein ELG77_33180 [Rhizobium leguminosarum]
MAKTEDPNTAARDAFSGFTPMDWVFLGLGYLAVMYFILQTGLHVIRPGEFNYDFMPLINGAMFIAVAWGGVRLSRRMKELVLQLGESSVVPFVSDAARAEATVVIASRSRKYSLIGAAVVSMSMLAGIASYSGILTGARIDFDQMILIMPGGDRWIALFAIFMLVIVFVPVGAIAGLFLGIMIANGRLLETFRGLGYDLSGFSSDSGSRALQAIEDIYAYAAMSTVILSAILASWWVAFTLKMPVVDGYQEWRWPFLWLWIIAMGGFIFAAYLPVRLFRQRLAKIYGGDAALDRVGEQLTLAREDANRIRVELANAGTSFDRQRLERRLQDLESFIEALKSHRFRKPILDSRFLNIWLVVNVLALVVPVAFSGRASIAISFVTPQAIHRLATLLALPIDVSLVKEG